VNSSAITARHPDVPNLICVAIGLPRMLRVNLEAFDFGFDFIQLILFS
jgi:hypothetical protein